MSNASCISGPFPLRLPHVCSTITDLDSNASAACTAALRSQGMSICRSTIWRGLPGNSPWMRMNSSHGTAALWISAHTSSYPFRNVRIMTAFSSRRQAAWSTMPGPCSAGRTRSGRTSWNPGKAGNRKRKAALE